MAAEVVEHWVGFLVLAPAVPLVRWQNEEKAGTVGPDLQENPGLV